MLFLCLQFVDIVERTLDLEQVANDLSLNGDLQEELLNFSEPTSSFVLKNYSKHKNHKNFLLLF